MGQTERGAERTDGTARSTWPRSLLANRSFRLFWAGRTLSEIGSGVSLLVAPLIAVQFLSASVFQVSILQAANSLAFLLAGLPLGVVLGRYRKRTSMIVADVVRAILITAAALTALTDRLNVAGLALAIVLVGVGTVAYEAACQALVPQLVRQSQLVDANGKLSASSSVALVVGPAVGGVLVATVGSAQALFFDAATYLVSVACLLRLPIREPQPRPAADPARSRPLAELVTGLRYIGRDRNLTALLAAGTSMNFFAQFIFAVEVVFLVRELGVPVALVAVPFSLATLGGIVGGLAAGSLAARLGTARVLWLVPLSTVWALLLL
ncbi:MAG: MFS transporter, partial [Dactylosporangium sp.]|nr:MFS transporter [Dactylosporangium sp.]